MLWILLTVMTAVAAAGLALPLVRRHDARRGGGADGGRETVAVLKAQLAELDAEAAARALPDSQARSLRVETQRRILAAGEEIDRAGRPLGERSRVFLGLGMAAVVALGGLGLYLMIGRPDLAGAPAAAPPPTAAADRPGPDFADLVTRLEARMKVAPGDPRGWRLLGWSYMRMGRYGEAAVAYGRAGALDPASAEYPSARGEALTAAAGGQVGPAARAAFTAALARNGADPRARYFLALARDQHGDHAGAMTAWIALLKSAPPGAPWAADVRGFVVRIARQNGEDIAGKLPPAPAADRVAPSLAMSAADRRATIEAMVGRLAARLKANPRDADGWARLMRARMVLGETAAAVVAYRDALAAFADSPADQAALRRRAEELAVPGTQARG